MLTRGEYELQRKRLENELKAKNLTQNEFNAYDIQAVTCLQ